MEEDTDMEKEIEYFTQNDPYKESKSLIKGFVIIVGICLVLSNTKPSYYSHTQTVSTKLSQTIVGDNKDRGFIWGLIDKGVGKYSELGLVKYGWKVDDLLKMN